MFNEFDVPLASRDKPRVEAPYQVLTEMRMLIMCTEQEEPGDLLPKRATESGSRNSHILVAVRPCNNSERIYTIITLIPSCSRPKPKIMLRFGVIDGKMVDSHDALKVLGLLVMVAV